MSMLPKIPVGTPIATSLPEQASGFGCPTCYNNGSGPLHMVYGRAGQFNYYCKFGHNFPDLMEFRQMNPPKMPVAQKVTPQAGWQTMNIQLPPEVLSSLQTKFGDKLGSTLSSVFRTLTQGRVFIVGSEDIERIELKLGQKMSGLPQFMGEVLSLVDKIAELRTQIESTTATPSTAVNGDPVKTRRGERIIWQNPEHSAWIAEKAKFNNITPEEQIEAILVMAIENNWA